jgi:hypothetical protein
MMQNPSLSYRPPVLRLLLFLIAWLGLGLWALNAVSQRRILECTYKGPQPHCQLTTQKWFESTGPIDLDRPQAAQLEEYDSNTSDSSTMYRVVLTTQGDRVALTDQDGSGFSHKHRIVEDINRFLAQPRSPRLRVDGGYGALLEIVGGFFGSLSVMVIGGTVVTVALWRQNRSLESDGRSQTQWWVDTQWRVVERPAELPRSMNWEDELTDGDP